MPVKQPHAVTFKGDSLTLVGPELRVGDRAPDFTVTTRDLKPFTLADTEGKARIFSVVPSIDTPLCDTQTRRFNKEASNLPGVRIYTVSMDLPFAQSRWCTVAGVDKVVMLSDHQAASFGRNYGTLVEGLRLEARALFVLDAAGVIRHVEYVKDVSSHPDYDAALAAAREVSSG
jgi:thioredoxin-dependent peroxiredoxin